MDSKGGAVEEGSRALRAEAALGTKRSPLMAASKGHSMRSGFVILMALVLAVFALIVPPLAVADRAVAVANKSGDNIGVVRYSQDLDAGLVYRLSTQVLCGTIAPHVDQSGRKTWHAQTPADGWDYAVIKCRMSGLWTVNRGGEYEFHGRAVWDSKYKVWVLLKLVGGDWRVKGFCERGLSGAYAAGAVYSLWWS